MLALLVWSSKYIDYGYTAFLIKRELIEGRSIETCFDLPEKYWRRIPKCVAPERDREEPSRLPSLEEEVG